MTSSIDETGYAEKRLLAACARTTMSPEAVSTLRELAARRLDWELVISAAAENSVMPLLARQCSVHAADFVPAEALETIKGAARANTLRCLTLTGELLRVLEELARRGIPAIPYKGPVLSAQIYADVAMREYEDLDIVLRHKDLEAADEAMKSLGYTARYPWLTSQTSSAWMVPGEYNYREQARGIMVELHTELTMRHFPERLELEELFSRLVSVNVGGHEVKTFCAEDLLPILCVHGAKDYWERLSWVADIAELAQENSGLDWNLAFRSSARWKADRMLNVGLALAKELLGAQLPPIAARRVEADRASESIAKGFAERLLDRERVPMDGKSVFKFRRQMGGGGLAGRKYAWRLALAPAEDDWKMAKLPSRLTPLYIALRPLRLLKKYGWTNRGSG
jgi:hypothetical protein